jgi:hypothetical protein
MTTKGDIEGGGGKCEHVSTNFWECTDKDGKVWWCDSTSCQPKPRMIGPIGTVRIDVAVMQATQSGKIIVAAPVGDARPELNLGQSVNDVREIANFFDRLAHELKETDLRAGQDLLAVAHERHLTLPDVLKDYHVTYSPHQDFDARALEGAIVVQLPPKPATADTIERVKLGPRCFDVNKTVSGVSVVIHVCISCSVSFSSVSCTVTLKATISI